MRVLALAVVVLGGVTGCSVALDDADAPAERRSETSQQEASTRAEVAVERAVSADGVARSHVSARFVSVTGAIDHDDASQVLGAAPLPEADEADRCARLTAPAALSSLGDGSIELLDVGDIVLRAGETVVPLAARAFPDVGELISGVVYTSRGVDQPLPDAVTYWVEAAGDGAGAPSLSVSAPAALADLQLQQEALNALGLSPQNIGPQSRGVQSGNRDDGNRDELVIVQSGEDVQLSWQAGNRSAGDYVVVELSEVGSESQAIQCVFADDGVAQVAGSFVTFAPGKDLDLVVRRVRKTKLSMETAAGTENLLGDAIVWFDFSLSARAVVQ